MPNWKWLCILFCTPFFSLTRREICRCHWINQEAEAEFLPSSTTIVWPPHSVVSSFNNSGQCVVYTSFFLFFLFLCCWNFISFYVLLVAASSFFFNPHSKLFRSWCAESTLSCTQLNYIFSSRFVWHRHHSATQKFSRIFGVGTAHGAAASIEWNLGLISGDRWIGFCAVCWIWIFENM